MNGKALKNVPRSPEGGAKQDGRLSREARVRELSRPRAGTIYGQALAGGMLAMVVGACGGGGGVTNVTPKAVWSYVENPDVTVTEAGNARYSIDFGTVALGEPATLEIRVTNQGAAPMIVLPIADLDAGFETDIPAAGLPVNIAETKSIKVSFVPTEELSYSWSGAITVSDYPEQDLSIVLAGVGQAPAFSCDATRLDFGRILKGRTATLSFNCRNDTQVDGVLIVSPISGENRALFGHPITGNGGHLALAAGQSQEIDVTYKADLVGDAFADLEILGEVNDDRSRVVDVHLQGVTVDHAIECDPSALDFGFVAPGREKPLEITCFNQATEPFEITGIALELPPDGPFSWEPTVTPIAIPAYANGRPGEQRITVTFEPTEPDRDSRRTGTLALTSTDETASRIAVSLTGFAGGPVISCSPGQIHFGQVAKDLPVTRAVTCTNSGSDDPTRNDDALVVTGLESTNPAEVTAVVRGGLDPAGYAVGQSFTFDVTYSPVDDGVDDNSIQILSNDTVHPPDDPYAVLVTGAGRDLPPCEFEIVPENGLRFGIVDKGASATLEFAVRNKRADAECMIQNLHLASTCASAFSLPSEVQLDVLPANGELRYPVTFAPTVYQSAPFTCDVLFDISNPKTPRQVVPVRGSSQSPCALISPNYLDFGTVKPNCSSRKREFQILNTCPSNLVIDHIEINTGVSDEFVLAATPTNGYSIAKGAAVNFTVAYQPKDEGTDLGSVFVYTKNTTEPYMAALKGRGATDATQVDAYQQNDRPKVDLLWVIDNSGSMSGAQSNLAANVTPFLDYANAQEIDYHVAITTTAASGSSDENGRFYPVDGAARGIPRIITRDTPSAKDVWAANIKVGTSGNSDEKPLHAAYLALTRPLVESSDADGNGGFLRPDAHLSIIVVTDEIDHSPETVTFYHSAFQNIKGFQNPHLFNFHAITGDKATGCTGNGGAEAGDRVIGVVEKTEGGLFQSICDSDWKPSLEKMAAAAFGFRTCFFLGNEPEDTNQNGSISDVEGEIQLALNGRPKSSTGPQGQDIWTYDAAQNAVCFGPFSVPEPGANLEVSYRVACRDP